ncbi:Lrp/AsnC family transcriptional regulator (plasmid) [Paenarthrobacter sp. OM7]|uniref:Lrp/AsnC family transcriptional regulator n=1 Tax=Paenarthrobacter sp. OM7 TaxID=3041264 RepID=UPI0024694004|nr:Lrp/AsnC family transcriptional regulator [Paenarthrobacter sp. OM7]WGM22859.1 Lrp/AsnC family transcriptional regulator [Paenarthrobacter sp. OM7]
MRLTTRTGSGEADVRAQTGPSPAELAELVGLSDRTVQRRISRLIGTRDIDFRCDISRPDAGWHAAAVLWLEMPDEMLERTGNALLTWPETRTCAAIAGSSNMLLTLGLHAVADLHSLASRVAERFPYVRIVDRQLVMRQVKLYGRILDPSGRSTGVVPVDPWGLSESQQGRIDVPRTP